MESKKLISADDLRESGIQKELRLPVSVLAE